MMLAQRDLRFEGWSVPPSDAHDVMDLRGAEPVKPDETVSSGN